MRSTRRSQPYRRTGKRQASSILRAMQAGTDFAGHNPMNASRGLSRAARRRRRARSV